MNIGKYLALADDTAVACLKSSPVYIRATCDQGGIVTLGMVNRHLGPHRSAARSSISVNCGLYPCL